MVEGEKIVFRLSKTLWNECRDGKVRNLEKMEAKQMEYSRHMKIIQESVSLGPLTCSECGLERTCTNCLESVDVVAVTSPGLQSRKRRLSEDQLPLNPQNVLDFLINALKSIPKMLMSQCVVSEGIEYYIGAVSTLCYQDLLNHLISVRVEYVQRLMRPLLHKLMAHQKNGDAFNSPVDVDGLGLRDYFTKIKRPMDLGRVKCNLLRGDYHSVRDCVEDIRLVFKNAIAYNPSSHIVHKCAVLLNDEFKDDVRALREKSAKEDERKSQHSCSICLGSSCILCGDKCLKYEPSILVCHGTCGQRIKRNSTYFVSIDGGMVWCQKCYTATGPVVVESYGPDHKPLHKKELLRRKFDEEALEPWVQCRSCSRRVHQVCALYNPLQDDSVLEDIGVGGRLPAAFFQCPICKVEAVFKPPSRITDAPAASRGASAEGVTKRTRKNSYCSRGDRIKHREERKADKGILFSSSPDLATVEDSCGDGTAGGVEGLGQAGGKLEPHLTGETVNGILGQMEDLCDDTELVDRTDRIASQHTGSSSSDTSHEAETVMGDEVVCSSGGEEGDGIDECNLPAQEPGNTSDDMFSECGHEEFVLEESVSARLHKGPTLKPQDRWTAASLPRSRLSDFIEAMVEDRLVQCGERELMNTLTIRMVSNCMHNFEVPDVITNNLATVDGHRVQQYLMYKQKCILLFQKIDGVDVCLFCLYVQEFDDRCPQPNKSKVYIAYLDSVEYFRPRSLRTTVYHEILVAYLKWSQVRGFQQGHIWACPPQRGDNFIFWCHPPQQRTPSRDRLNGWYNTMLARASGLGILSSVDTLWASYFSAYGKREETAVRTASKNSFVSKNSQAIAARRAVNGKAEAPISTATPPTPVCPPVFEGDFWVNECSRVYRLVQMRARGLEGQDRHVNQRRCREMLKQMMSKPTAIAFNQPVDPVLLNIPDYPLIIRNPMDLGTVRDRLRVNAYRTILDFANDIRLTFTNAMAYNPAGHTIHVYAVKLLEDFEAQLVDVVTERIGALLAGSGNIDSWLGGYPLNSEIERELQEKQSADEMAKLANGGFASTGGASGSCDTRRVSFPSSLDDMITSERDDGDDCENWTAGDVSGEYAEGQGSEEDKEEGPQESMDEEEASGDADYLGSDLTNVPTLRRHDSMESCVSVTEMWPRRPTNSRANVCTEEDVAAAERRQKFPVVETPFEKSQLGQKGVMTLMSELSRHVCRLKEDMYVITFSSGEGSVQKGPTGEPAGEVRAGSAAPLNTGRGKGKALYGSLGRLGPDNSKSCESHGVISSRCLAMLVDIPSDTSDPDEIRRCPFADSRQTFLELSQYRHFQFDSLRRAKHSSMMILFHLLYPHAKYIRPVCSECDAVISEVRWHCNQCISGEYDVCSACMSAPWFSHPHPELTPVHVPLV